MAVNPTSFRYPFALKDQPPEVKQAHLFAFNGLLDVNQAIASMKTQIETLKSGTTAAAAAAAETVQNITSETVIVESNTIGFLNNQSGNTAYTTQQADYGSFILLNDASPIAVSLSVTASLPGITLPWFTTIINSGSGTATLTPVSGTINGGSSFAVAGGNVVTVVFDGTNFWLEPAVALPLNTPAVAHQWLSAYNAATGAFTQTQPAFADISGTLAAGQLPATGISVTIVTAQLTSLGAQGSQTFTNGILTAQVQAT